MFCFCHYSRPHNSDYRVQFQSKTRFSFSFSFDCLRGRFFVVVVVAALANTLVPFCQRIPQKISIKMNIIQRICLNSNLIRNRGTIKTVCCAMNTVDMKETMWISNKVCLLKYTTLRLAILTRIENLFTFDIHTKKKKKLFCLREKCKVIHRKLTWFRSEYKRKN